MYSQRDEETYILRFFRNAPQGRFLDIGAYDGHTFSNTKALADKGWGGVCVEAAPTVFTGLLETYKGRSDIQLVCAAVTTDGNSLTPFHLSYDAVSTTVEAHRDLWAAQDVAFFPILMATVSAENLVWAAPARPYEFVNIDTEGTSVDIFTELLGLTAGRPARMMETQLWCVEHDMQWPRIGALCHQYGLEQVHQTAENVLLRTLPRDG